ncbi:hypothetical protein COLO4_35562 [Corchorus olitorius]|uniref:Uncharacterized protein n=1 Tax=Corchorus olitorius TaxID=93759 RepID=A0A1R3GF92_9ROSI|nr:hypothetical protein COLO4_35562 [Corchorus olitorius]
MKPMHPKFDLDQGKRADTCGNVAELAWTPGELLCNC